MLPFVCDCVMGMCVGNTSAYYGMVISLLAFFVLRKETVKRAPLQSFKRICVWTVALFLDAGSIKTPFMEIKGRAGTSKGKSCAITASELLKR